MKIGLQLSFVAGTVDGKLLSYLFDKYVKFTPYAFSVGSKTKPWNEKKHRKALAGITADEWHVSVYDLHSNGIHMGKTGTKVPHTSVSIYQDSDCFLPITCEINEIVGNTEGFVAAYLYDEEYHSIQSESFINNLSHRNIPQQKWDSIKNTPHYKDVHGFKYDTRFNAGRKVLIGHTWLMSAWKMWFGTPFFQLVPKERMLAFPHAVEVKELPTGHVYVQLFESIDQSHTPDAMFRQWKWQEWMNFEELENLNP